MRLTTVNLVSQARLSLGRRESGPRDYSKLVTLVVLRRLFLGLQRKLADGVK